MKRTDVGLFTALLLLLLTAVRPVRTAGADDLAQSFREPPDSARPGVYWYFMDGNLSREGMTRDLESMKAAGLGHLVFLEVNVGVPRGPVDFLSEPWQDLFVHAVREAERLGIEITLGAGPHQSGPGTHGADRLSRRCRFYELLVLPHCETMTPELLRKVESLVKDGATVVGNPPRQSPSLVDYPACDREVARRVEAIWGGMRPPAEQAVRRHGQGRVIWGDPLRGGAAAEPSPIRDAQWIWYPDYDLTAAILHDLGVAEDFISPGPVRYTHRRTEDRDIYFLANRSDQPLQTSATFRVATGAPELWNPLSGGLRQLPQFSRAGELTGIPLRFEPFESFFVVFPAEKSPVAVAPASGTEKNFADLLELCTLDRAWDVSFDPAMGAPATVRFEKLEDWTQRPEPGLKYYSGMATYRTTFDLAASEISNPKSQIHLALGSVQVMARVRVNGIDCGVVWTAPWRVEISRAVKATGNALEIEVANLWPNRMIGDAAAPDHKFTQTTYRPFKAGDPLLPSGLLGPVRLMKSSGPGER